MDTQSPRAGPNMWYPKNVCFAAKVLHLFYLWRTRGSLPSDLVVPYFQATYMYIWFTKPFFMELQWYTIGISYIYRIYKHTVSQLKMFFGVELSQKSWILNCIGSSCSWGKPTSLRIGVIFENGDVWVDMRYSLISWSRVEYLLPKKVIGVSHFTSRPFSGGCWSQLDLLSGIGTYQPDNLG